MPPKIAVFLFQLKEKSQTSKFNIREITHDYMNLSAILLP